MGHGMPHSFPPTPRRNARVVSELSEVLYRDWALVEDLVPTARPNAMHSFPPARGRLALLLYPSIMRSRWLT
jgi:hypothetical protein